LTFDDFVQMNQFVGVALNKKDLKRTFDIIDRSKRSRIRIDEIKGISNLVANQEEEEEEDGNLSE